MVYKPSFIKKSTNEVLWDTHGKHKNTMIKLPKKDTQMNDLVSALVLSAVLGVFATFLIIGLTSSMSHLETFGGKHEQSR